MEIVIDVDETPYDEKEHKRRISGWMEYYKQQPFIKIVNNEVDSFDKICAAMELNCDNVAFVALLPVTFGHLRDFNNGLQHAETRFCFMKDGTVETADNTGLGTIDYGKAFAAIINRVTGADIAEIVPDLPEERLLTKADESVLIEKMESFEINIRSWLEKFDKLPAVSWTSYQGLSNPLAIIAVKVAFPNSEDCEEYVLNIGNKAKEANWNSANEISDLYCKWREGCKFSTYAEFYEALVELSNLYVNVPQA